MRKGVRLHIIFLLLMLTSMAGIRGQGYCEDFEYSGWYLPDTWQVPYSDYTFYPELTNGIVYEGDRSLRMAYTCYAVMPIVGADSLNGMMMSWMNYGYLPSVGIFEDPTDSSSFIPLSYSTINYGSWTECLCDLSQYQGSGHYIGFRTTRAGSTYIDNIAIQSCHPGTVTIGRVTATTATVVWQSSIGMDSLVVEYGPEGFQQGQGSTLTFIPSESDTTNSMRIRGLAPSTTYDYFPHPYCSGSGESCSHYRHSFTTNAAAVTDGYCEDFNDMDMGEYPQDWSRLNQYDGYPQIYSHMLTLYHYDNDSIRELVVLPDMGVNDVRQLSLSFRVRVRNYSNYNFYIEAGVLDSPDDATSFVAVDTVMFTNDAVWNRVAPDLSKYSGNGTDVAIGYFSTGSHEYVDIDDIVVIGCPMPRAHVSGSTSLTLVSPISAPDYYIELGSDVFIPGEGDTVIHVTDSAHVIDGLSPGTIYSIHQACDSAGLSSCYHIIYATTAPLPLPWCHELADTLLCCDAYSTVWLRMPELDMDSLSTTLMSLTTQMGNGAANDAVITIGTLSDPHDFNTFTPLWVAEIGEDSLAHTLKNLSGAPSGDRFLALRLQNSGDSTLCVHIGNIFVDSCGVTDAWISEIFSDHIVIGWHQLGNPDITIVYNEADSANAISMTPQTTTPGMNSCSIEGLSPLKSYILRLSSLCSPGDSGLCNSNYQGEMSFVTPDGNPGCLDATDFTAPYVICSHGSFSHPGREMGVVDFGPLSAASRHTVHDDTSETDPRTGGLLHTVMPGSNSSVRVGNWSVNDNNPEGESITYALHVDTSSAGLLILNYAVVLQASLHDTHDQARFKLELLDSRGTPMDAACGQADFVASQQLGWNMASDSVLWKDWTTVGLDLSSYANQTIYVRLTTRDCNIGEHYGYAYFNLHCAMKNMYADACVVSDSNTFTAPAGFNYRWYSDDSTSTLSNEASIRVPGDSVVTYYCQCSFIDEPSCHFTITAFAGNRLPLARFDYTTWIEDCKMNVQFNNTSTISADGITPLPGDESCETALWLFSNGDSSLANNPLTFLSDTGTFQVTLITTIADGLCADTAQTVINVSFPMPSSSLSGPDTICQGDSATLRISDADNIVWWNGSTTDSIRFSPESTANYSCSFTDNLGCNDTLFKQIVVNSVTQRHDTAAICENELPYLWIDTSVAPDTLGIWHLVRQMRSTHGCDSILDLQLTVQGIGHDIVFDTVSEDELPLYLSTDVVVDMAMDTILDVLFQLAGRCDSIVTHHVHVLQNIYIVLDSSVCSSDMPLTWDDSLFTEAGIKVKHFLRPDGSDSVVTMHLTVLPIPTISVTQDIDCIARTVFMQAHSDVDHIFWSCDTDWDPAWGQQNSPSFIVLPAIPLTFIVTADYNDYPTCPATQTVTIEPVITPEADFDARPEIVTDEDNTITAVSRCKNAQTIQWYVDGEAAGSDLQITVSPREGEDSISITIVATNGTCHDTSSRTIHILHHHIYAPNAFTPDESTNNLFLIKSDGLVEQQLDIFTRNGRLVHSTHDGTPWDGTHNGIKCPQGCYIWTLRYRIEADPLDWHQANGTVLLLR